MAIDKKHLLLCSDSRDATLYTTFFDHPCERGQIFEQRLHEGLRLLFINLLFDVMFSHVVIYLQQRAKTRPPGATPKYSFPRSLELTWVAMDARPTRDTAPGVALDLRWNQTTRAFRTPRRALPH